MRALRIESRLNILLALLLLHRRDLHPQAVAPQRAERRAMTRPGIRRLLLALALHGAAGCSLLFPFQGVSGDKGAGRESGRPDGATESLGAVDAHQRIDREGGSVVDHRLPDRPANDVVTTCAFATFPNWTDLSPAGLSNTAFHAVAGTGPKDIWVVGGDATVLQYNPSSCSFVQVDLAKLVSSATYKAHVSGRSYSGVWKGTSELHVVGSGGAVLD
jgi:hypothetical protein